MVRKNINLHANKKETVEPQHHHHRRAQGVHGQVNHELRQSFKKLYLVCGAIQLISNGQTTKD